MSYAKYIKVFVVVATAIWLVMFPLFALLLGSARNAFGAGIVVGMLFGAILAGLVYWLDQKRREDGLEVDDFDVKPAENTVEVPRGVAEAMTLCKAALKIFPGARIEREGENFLVARTGPSARSLGEILEFAAEPHGQGALVGIHSKPRHSWTPVDFGKNAENVKRLSREIEKRAAAKP